ncbi:060L [Invertebrate iridescent virus Kaz2018]|nr:060L [Invertebrate iridescent virus Kaz2018]
MSKNKSPLLNESEKMMSEMLPMKVSQSKLNYEEKVYIPTTIRNRKQHCFRRFFPYIALFQIIMLIILLILYFCFPNLFYSTNFNTNFNTSLLQNNSIETKLNSIPPQNNSQKTEVPIILNYTTQKTEVTEPIIINNTTEEIETQTIMIPKSTDQTQTIISAKTTAIISPPETSETIAQVLKNSDKREHDNEELSFTTEMETITTEIETSSTIPHLRSLPIKSELSMETTSEETDEE